MENLSALETSALVDLLSEHTANYTRMLSQGCAEIEYLKLKVTIETLQKEIESRKNSFGANVTQSEPPPDFT